MSAIISIYLAMIVGVPADSEISSHIFGSLLMNNNICIENAFLWATYH